MTFKSIERALNLALPAEIELQVLYLVFNVSRTPVRLARGMQPEGFVQSDAGALLAGAPPDEPTHPNVLAFEVLDLVRARDEFRELVFESLGERPELVRIVLQTPTQILVAKTANEPCLDTLHLQFAPEPGGAAQNVPGPAQYTAELQAALQAPPGPHPEASRFFAHFDHVTLDVLGATPSMTTAIESVSLMAQQRLSDRLKEHLADPTSYTPYPFSETERTDLRRVAELFVETASTYLAPKGTRFDRLLGPRRAAGLSRQEKAAAAAGIDLKSFEQAFEAFADGNLRIKLQPSGMRSTQPSSGFYFYFAELALLAAEAELDPPLDRKLWEALGNVMVRTQEVFAARYGPEEALHHDRDTSSYGACLYREDADMQTSSNKRKIDARNKFEPAKTLQKLAVACAQNTMDMLRKEATNP